jgi:tRNA 2-selenouridine synthase
LAIKKLTVDNWLDFKENHLLIDVRSPSEYNHAHIPGAISLPLLSDEERKVVGTLYKQQSRELAIKKGLDFFGVKMRKMVEEIETLIKHKHESKVNTLVIHCWRGGMRSATVAWLFDLYGFKVYTIEGGYKKYRHWVIEKFNQHYPIEIIGGYTGSAKTEIIQSLKLVGEQTIDLEGLANHKGSAFGAIGMPVQPSQEMFENLLATELSKYKEVKTTIWVEDESQRIGLVNIPQPLWNQLRTKQVYFFDIPFEKRLNYLVLTYGVLPKDKLNAAILRIQKRLGGLETKNSVQFLENDEIHNCFNILLKYYDKLYIKGLQNRPQNNLKAITILAINCDSKINAEKLLQIKAN